MRTLRWSFLILPVLWALQGCGSEGNPEEDGDTGHKPCYATGLTRGEILEALAARRCFATNSHSNVAHFPMEMTFKIDGRWMGESIVATAVEGEKLWSSPLWIDVSG